jgi:uncharacterized BrkB/YihY/UPF0761 family membrane protein
VGARPRRLKRGRPQAGAQARTARARDPEGLESAAREFGITAAAAKGAAEALQHSDRSLAVVLAFGLALLAWFTLGALRALVLAHALAWRMPPPRIRRPFRAVAVFNGLFLVQIAASAGSSWLREQVGVAALFGVVPTVALTVAVAVAAMWLLPHRTRSPRDLLPGAILVGVGLQLVNVAVVFYFAPRLGEAEQTFGAFGAAATMLIWLYVLARLITASAFLNATLWSRRVREAGRTAEPAPGA